MRNKIFIVILLVWAGIIGVGMALNIGRPEPAASAGATPAR